MKRPVPEVPDWRATLVRALARQAAQEHYANCLLATLQLQPAILKPGCEESD